MGPQRSQVSKLQRLFAVASVLLLLFGMVGYARGIVGPVKDQVERQRGGNDFASYYYAFQVGVEGGSPYNTSKLGEKCEEQTKRKSCSVHPFFYPPPYLLVMAWSVPMDLHAAYMVFFWMGSLFLISVMLALWRWVGGPLVFGMSGVLLLSFTPIHDTLRMGQANLMVLALMVWGVMLAEWQGANKRQWAGGALVGLACMMKMSPALLVLWWMVRKAWKPVFGAIAAAIISSLLVLPFVGLEHQLEFYSTVLPGFTSGNYHDLSVPLNIPMNHSVLNFWMQVTSGFGGLVRLSEPSLLASNLARATALGLLVSLFFLLKAPEPDPLSRSNAASAFVVLMVLVPAYSYEHHLVFLLFPLLTVAAALGQGRLHWKWSFLYVAVFVILAWELKDFKAISRSLGGGELYSAPAVAFRELKFLAAFGLGALCTLAALSPARPEPSPDDGLSEARVTVKRVRPAWEDAS